MTVGTICSACGQTVQADNHGCIRCPECGGQKSAGAVRCYKCAWPDRQPRSTRASPVSEELASTTAPHDRRTRIAFRVYCFACGRAVDVEVAPRDPGRCQACGGSLLVELRD
jgi:rRNA maturation endonuclease Nob1